MFSTFQKEKSNKKQKSNSSQSRFKKKRKKKENQIKIIRQIRIMKHFTKEYRNKISKKHNIPENPTSAITIYVIRKKKISGF